MADPDMKFESEESGKRSSLRATFSREGNSDYVDIAIVGDPNVFRGKVRPEHISRFPLEWDAYQKNRDPDEIATGTPLTEIPGVTLQVAKQYKLKGVRNVEELASLNDAACSRMGIGSIELRKAAMNLLKAKRTDELEELLAEKRKPGRPKKPESVAA